MRNLLVVNLVASNFGVLINEAKEINQSVESSNMPPSFFNGLVCFSVFVFIFFPCFINFPVLRSLFVFHYSPSNAFVKFDHHFIVY